MKNLIVAREKEQAVFERLLNEPTAQKLVVYGRRKMGKTTGGAVQMNPQVEQPNLGTC